MGKPVERMTSAERGHLAAGSAVLAHVEADIRRMAWAENLPKGWGEIAAEEEPGTGRRARVTLPMDAAVLRFFKSAGPGHLRRMERVLRAYMEFRLARALTASHQWCDLVAEPKKVIEDWRSPKWNVRTRLDLVKETKGKMEKLKAAYDEETKRADEAEAAAREIAEAMREVLADLEDGEEDGEA